MNAAVATLSSAGGTVAQPAEMRAAQTAEIRAPNFRCLILLATVTGVCLFTGFAHFTWVSQPLLRNHKQNAKSLEFKTRLKSESIQFFPVMNVAGSCLVVDLLNSFKSPDYANVVSRSLADHEFELQIYKCVNPHLNFVNSKPFRPLSPQEQHFISPQSASKTEASLQYQYILIY